MGKPTLKIGRKRPKRELNPVDQWRKKLKEKKHVKDYLRKLKKKQREQAEEPESSEESSSSEEVPEPTQMKPLTLQAPKQSVATTSASVSAPVPAPVPASTSAAGSAPALSSVPPTVPHSSQTDQGLFKALLSDDKAVSDFFKEISDLL